MRDSRRLLLFLLVSGAVLSAVPCGAQTSPRISTPTQPQTQSQTEQRMTLMEAESIAIQNHPRIQAAAQLALAAAAQVKEVQSAYYPQANGALTGAKAETNSRIAAGFLNSPSLFDKFAEGVSVSQLLTDFGRTHEFAKSSRFHAQAEQESVVTTRADVLLRVNLFYFGVLKAQSVLRVAEETVKARQLVADQVSALAKSSLKSGLDVSFANVDLARAQLLLVQAQNDLQSSYAQLADALGYSDQRTFQLGRRTLAGRSRTRCCAAHRRSVSESAGDHQPRTGREVGAKLCHSGTRSLVSHDFGRRSDRPRPLSAGPFAQPLRRGWIQRQRSHF